MRIFAVGIVFDNKTLINLHNNTLCESTDY